MGLLRLSRWGLRRLRLTVLRHLIHSHLTHHLIHLRHLLLLLLLLRHHCILRIARRSLPLRHHHMHSWASMMHLVAIYIIDLVAFSPLACERVRLLIFNDCLREKINDFFVCSLHLVHYEAEVHILVEGLVSWI